MKRSSWFAIALIAVLTLGLAALKIAGRPPVTDQDQIHSLLAKGQTAVERKDLKNAMSCIARGYKDSNGIRYEQLKVQAIQAFQQESRYDLSLEETSVQVEGETATVNATLSVGIVSRGTMHPLFSGPIVIRLAKEKSMRWLVIPAAYWKITSMEGVPVDVGG